MDHTEQPDLTGEQQREYEAAAVGITPRAILDLDVDDEQLEAGDEAGDAHDNDDGVVEDLDDAVVDPYV